MTNARWPSISVLAAPVAAIGIGVWAEFADLSPPVLLAVATPAIAVTLLASVIARGLSMRAFAIAAMGAAIGLATFSMAAGLYIVIHLARGGGVDLNGADEGGSAGVFFVVHVAVGTATGVALGVVGAAIAWAVRVGRGRAGGSLLQEPDSSLRSE